MRGKHQCPGCRKVSVPNNMLACLPCWRELPAPIQREIKATTGYLLLHPRRVSAIEMAVDFWRQ